jgi:hypothetical protein
MIHDWTYKHVAQASELENVQPDFTRLRHVLVLWGTLLPCKSGFLAEMGSVPI